METYKDLIMALAKVIIAVAWADHELDEEEIESLKDVVHHLGSTFDMGSQLSGHEWEQLKMYMESPVDQEELDQLVINLQDAIRNADEKGLVLNSLDNIVKSDGEVTEEEQDVLDEIKASIDQVGTGVGRLGWAIRKSMGRRSKKAQSTVTLGSTVISANGELDMPAVDLRRLVLAARLMARVAFVDREVLEEEQQLMEDVMKAYWKASPERPVSWRRSQLTKERQTLTRCDCCASSLKSMTSLNVPSSWKCYSESPSRMGKSPWKKIGRSRKSAAELDY